MLVRMPAKKGHEESAPWICPEFIESVVPDKDDLSQAFVYMQSGMSMKVKVDQPYMAFQQIYEVIRKAQQRENDFNASFDDYWNKENRKHDNSAGKEV